MPRFKFLLSYEIYGAILVSELNLLHKDAARMKWKNEILCMQFKAPLEKRNDKYLLTNANERSRLNIYWNSWSAKSGIDGSYDYILIALKNWNPGSCISWSNHRTEEKTKLKINGAAAFQTFPLN